MLRAMLGVVIAILCEQCVYADLVYLVVGSTTTVNFTGYTGLGFQSSPALGQLDSDDWAATGWSDGDLAFGASQTSGDYARGTTTGGVTTGGFYAVNNITGTSGVSIGIQPGGSDWAPGTLTLQIRNNTGATLNSINIGYDLFVRNDQDRSNSFNFSYAVGVLNTPGTFTGSGINNDSFTSSAASDASGWVAQRASTSLTSISTTINNGQSVFLRWSGADVGGGGSRDEFAIDNITFSGITAVPEPSSVLLFAIGVGVFGITNRRRLFMRNMD